MHVPYMCCGAGGRRQEGVLWHAHATLCCGHDHLFGAAPEVMQPELVGDHIPLPRMRLHLRGDGVASV